jgi:tRNA pseudouridine55 synthase
MKNIILINKKTGETPLEAINRIKDEDSSLSSRKIAYAGRLDPMARGLLLLLLDEECSHRDKYQNLDKVYEFELLLGVETDTYDILGLAKNVGDTSNFSNDEIDRSILKFQGALDQKYPPYSSFHVNGKPLFWYAREGKLDTIEIPTKRVEIKKLEILKFSNINSKDLFNDIEHKVNLVHGDFRQNEILANWSSNLKDVDLEFRTVSIRAEVSSGTYIRSLCNSIGEELGCGGIAWDINRISIGKFKLHNVN